MGKALKYILLILEQLKKKFVQLALISLSPFCFLQTTLVLEPNMWAKELFTNAYGVSNMGLGGYKANPTMDTTPHHTKYLADYLMMKLHANLILDLHYLILCQVSFETATLRTFYCPNDRYTCTFELHLCSSKRRSCKV